MGKIIEWPKVPIESRHGHGSRRFKKRYRVRTGSWLDRAGRWLNLQ